MKCPKCKKSGLEISKVDLNLDRKGIQVWITCSDNVCEFSKVLELSLDDIIGIGRSQEIETATKEAVRRAMEKVK